MLTGQQTLGAACSIAYDRIRRRKWHYEGREYTPWGMNWREDFVLFCSVERSEHGVRYHHRRMSVADALDAISGDMALSWTGTRIACI